MTGTPRLGIPTASNFHCIISPTGRAVDSRERKMYMYKLVAERIMGEPLEMFRGNEHTEWGIQHEDEAARALSVYLGQELVSAEFTTNGRWGCTPDRLVAGKREAVEIKCPSTPWTHIANMVDGPGEKYKPQVQGQLLIGKFDAVHFWSWHPKFAAVYIRTARDEKYIKTMRELLERFSDELDKTEEWVRKQGNVGDICKELSDDEEI